MKRLRVLNTRPREQAAELSRLLLTAGFSVVEAPAIAIEPAWDASELAAVRADLASGAFDWVVLASANAGRSLDVSGVRALCGSSTARALGLARCETLERFSAAAVLDYLGPRVHHGERVLVPRGAEGRDELVDGLRDLGLHVSAPVAYHTVAVSEAADGLAGGGIDVVALCSPSAARSVARAVTPALLIACLGGTTSAAARAAGLRVDVVATETSMPALVAAIETLAGARV